MTRSCAGLEGTADVVGAGEGEDGGLVGGEPGDEALLVDVIGEEEHLVAEVQSADVRVHDARRATALLRRCKRRPALDEVGRGAQLVDQRGELMVVTPAGGRGAEPADLLVGRRDPVGVHRSRARVEEDVACKVRHVALEHSERTDEPLPRVVPREYIAGWANHERRRRAESLEERHHCRSYGAGQRAGCWAQLPALADHGQRVELPALLVVEAQCVGERDDHTRRGSGVAALLETNEVVDADPGERRHLFAAQTRSSPATAVGQPDIAGLQLLPASPKELGHRRHPTSMPEGPAKHPGPASTRISPAFPHRRSERMLQP